jgi:2,4-dienoyl-CoA reductase (NADPH2)
MLRASARTFYTLLSAVPVLAMIFGIAKGFGLARVLWADPDWVHKVSSGRESDVLHCDPGCGDACIQMVIKKKPAFCTRWPPQKVNEYKVRFE